MASGFAQTDSLYKEELQLAAEPEMYHLAYVRLIAKEMYSR
jgi:hypothetical protein